MALAAITVRNLDDDIRDELRVRAAQHGRSMEAEVRAILTAAVGQGQDRQPNALMDLYWAGRAGIDVDLAPDREVEAPRVDFTDDAFG